MSQAMTNSTEDRNNHAVSLLSEGDYRQALNTLRSALCPLLQDKRIFDLLNNRQEHQTQRDAMECDSSCDKLISVHDENIVLLQDQQRRGIALSADFGPSTPTLMYSKAFRLVPSCGSPTTATPNNNESGDFSHDTRKNLQSYAVMCYNLGLILHGQGIQLGVSAAFPKALTMYTWSIRLIHEAYSKEEIFGRDDVSHIHLALLNNMGDIYQQLVQEEEASFCFRQMHLFLSYLAQLDESSTKCFSFFATNAVSSQYEFPPSPAPAA